jgi:hypothetical protein
MVSLLQKLYPFFLNEKNIFLNELEDVQEVLFINIGKIDIGYEINKRIYFKLRIDCF